MKKEKPSYIRLGGGLEICRVLTGLWQIADMEKDRGVLDPMSTATYMDRYVQAGFTTFDMADHYGSAEVIAGTYAATNDKRVQLLTKWVPKPGVVSVSEVRGAIQKSLDRLQTSSIDLLQYHAWNYADPNYLDQLFVLQSMKEEGLIKHLGLTNFDANHLRVVCASGIDVVTNQISYSLLDQRASQDMTNVCEEFDVKILAFGTVGGGFLSEKWLGREDPKSLSSWSLMKYSRFIEAIGGWSSFQRLLKVLSEIAGKHEVSLSNVASKYILDQPQVAGVIIGARLGESEHIDDNLNLFGFQLSENDTQSIKSVIKGFRPIPGGCGDEYRKPPFLTASGDLSHHLETIPKPFKTLESDGIQRVMSGTTWEDEFGYCRALKVGNQICVSGTTASHGDILIGDDDPEAQAHFVIDKIEGALQSLGSKLEDVVRTRIFVQHLDDWEPIARAHGKRFAHIKPANTLVQAGLVGKEFLVEIEAEALIAENTDSI